MPPRVARPAVPRRGGDGRRGRSEAVTAVMAVLEYGGGRRGQGAAREAQRSRNCPRRRARVRR